MSQPAPVLTFFNNKGGVGKTSLIYHLAWMYASLRKRVVIADLDPQANLTAAFLVDDAIEEIWSGRAEGSTIYQCVKPLTDVGDIAEPVLQRIETICIFFLEMSLCQAMKMSFPAHGRKVWLTAIYTVPCGY